MTTNFFSKGPILNQNYPKIAEIAMYVKQNTMFKHDFVNLIQFIYYLKLNPFVDVYHSQFHIKPPKDTRQKTNISKNHSLTCMLGGAKVPRSKQEKYTSTTGSSFFGGNILSQYPYFTFENSNLLSVQQAELIASATYQLLHILPKKSIHEFRSQVNLICCIPVTNILTRLTKKTLSMLPYVSDGVVCTNISRTNLIADIASNMSQHATDELYCLFKLHK